MNAKKNTKFFGMVLGEQDQSLFDNAREKMGTRTRAETIRVALKKVLDE